MAVEPAFGGATDRAVGDVRGLGAMMAMEFVKNGDPLQPDAETCTALMNACAKRDLVVISAGTEKNIIRVLCPLVITDEQLSDARTHGVDEGLVFEVLAQVSANTFTNYANHVADTDIDFPKVNVQL